MRYIIAHRGVSAELPENTLPAFKRAIELNVDFIEFDVRLSRDGVPVIFHDVTTCRTTDTGKRHIMTDLLFSDIRRLDAGSWFNINCAGHHIPTLKEILELQRGSIGLMIEIKEELIEPKLIAKAVLDVIEKQPRSEENGPIIIGSFSPDILQEFRRLAPETQLIGIIKNLSKLPNFLKLKPEKVAIKHIRITKELVEELNQKNIEVWSYTIDDPEEAKRLYDIGVCGIITNDPRKIGKTLKVLA